MSIRHGLAAEYCFAGSADDTSGCGRHGVVHGATLTADRFGRRDHAYHFDGVDDYIEVAPPPAFSSEGLSVSAWVRYEPRDFRGWTNCLVAQDDGDDEDQSRRVFQLSTDSGHIVWHRMIGARDPTCRHRVQPGVWCHVAAVHDHGRNLLYVDGSLHDTVEHRLWTHSAQPMHIGRKGTPEPHFYFHGAIDDVRVHARALSDAEVRELLHEAGWEPPEVRGPGPRNQADRGMTVRAYLLSAPERVVRSVLGLGAGVARELGEVALPEGIRRSQLYQNLVDATLRFLIEQVGDVDGVYRADGTLPDDFLARRTAGNAVEVLGIVAFRASPVWVLAALADLCGMGRHLIPEMAGALKAQGLLEKDAEFTSVDQMLDGLERTSSRLAATMNTPPLDVAGLRQEWEAIREEARTLPRASLPSRDAIGQMWTQLKTESVRQDRSVFETSSMMAVAAARAVPDGVRWLSASARVGATRTGHIVAAALLDHYRQTLSEIQQVGYVAYAGRQFRPYVRAAVDQFSPKRRTLTQRLLERLRSG